MNKFGKVAVTATKALHKRRELDPIKAWELAVKTVFPKSISSQKKGCPKEAYFGLCEEGLIKGVRKGNYTRSILNKQYAVEAVDILKKRPSLASVAGNLWKEIMQGEQKAQNNQMDVVISLWNENLIK